MKVTLSISIHAPKRRVWEVLADVENIPQWSDVVVSARAFRQKQGVGTLRICDLKNGTRIFEEWTNWDEGTSYSYRGFNLPTIKTAQNTWSLKSESEQQTRLTTTAEVIVKGGILGRCLEPIIWVVSRKMGMQALSKFKRLAETTEP